MNVCSDPYTLPTIEFVGGATQDLTFHVGDSDDNTMDLTGCKAVFSVSDFVHRSGTAAFSKQMEIEQQPGNAYPDTLTVTLEYADTLNMSGKYVYQITVSDSVGNTDISQGIIYAKDNIDRKCLK